MANAPRLRRDHLRSMNRSSHSLVRILPPREKLTLCVLSHSSSPIPVVTANTHGDGTTGTVSVRCGES
jgi:hypothetical protein